MATKLLSIVIPVYNEKTNIEPSAFKLLNEFSEFENSLEILFVDDNSPDGTADEVNRISQKFPQIRLVQNGKKEGIGAAHKAGYKASTGQYILCIDASIHYQHARIGDRRPQAFAFNRIGFQSY